MDEAIIKHAVKGKRVMRRDISLYVGKTDNKATKQGRCIGADSWELGFVRAGPSREVLGNDLQKTVLKVVSRDQKLDRRVQRSPVPLQDPPMCFRTATQDIASIAGHS